MCFIFSEFHNQRKLKFCFFIWVKSFYADRVGIEKEITFLNGNQLNRSPLSQCPPYTTIPHEAAQGFLCAVLLLKELSGF
ncbi:MAG: hypothetical protein IJK97_10605, partial [Thermoguttaceae bacterium]|nr:hypothetical protein [Thermoguttaceae bacterium]